MADVIRMIQTMRWFGKNDPVPLDHIRMAGATGVVTSLHDIPIGEPWSVDAIMAHKETIEKHNLAWVVVESIPVHEDIKLRRGDFRRYIDNYKTSLHNLAQCGIRTICYNFMPLLDWTRTDLRFSCPDGSLALAFHWLDLAVFDVYIHKRKGAEHDYTPFTPEEIQRHYQSMDQQKIREIEDNILKGLPGAEPSYTVESFRQAFDRFRNVSREELRQNLVDFLKDIMPTAEAHKLRLAIHPDDPPVSLFGLPRVVSSEADLRHILNQVDSPSNGFTLCTGSLGVDPGNDLNAIIRNLGSRMYFIHLRNIIRDGKGSFYESDHLAGDVDMKAVVGHILALMKNRGEAIPMRPDHGHQMLDDLNKPDVNPGYTAIGRLRGLAELRGLEHGLLTADPVRE